MNDPTHNDSSETDEQQSSNSVEFDTVAWCESCQRGWGIHDCFFPDNPGEFNCPLCKSNDVFIWGPGPLTAGSKYSPTKYKELLEFRRTHPEVLFLF